MKEEQIDKKNTYNIISYKDRFMEILSSVSYNKLVNYAKNILIINQSDPYYQSLKQEIFGKKMSLPIAAKIILGTNETIALNKENNSVAIIEAVYLIKDTRCLTIYSNQTKKELSTDNNIIKDVSIVETSNNKELGVIEYKYDTIILQQLNNISLLIKNSSPKLEELKMFLDFLIKYKISTKQVIKELDLENHQQIKEYSMKDFLNVAIDIATTNLKKEILDTIYTINNKELFYTIEDIKINYKIENNGNIIFFKPYDNVNFMFPTEEDLNILANIVIKEKNDMVERKKQNKKY
jgi:hypothetical protein